MDAELFRQLTPLHTTARSGVHCAAIDDAVQSTSLGDSFAPGALRGVSWTESLTGNALPLQFAHSPQNVYTLGIEMLPYFAPYHTP